MILVAVVATLLVAVAINRLVLPDSYLVGALYAVPVLVAAIRWSPRMIAATGGLAVGTYAADALSQEQRAEVRPFTLLALLVIGVLAVLLARQRERADVRAREAEAALRVRDEFLSVAAHELRTPVTSLLGFAQLARQQLDGTAPPTPMVVERTLGAIDRQSTRLSLLINRLLDVSRLDTGRLTLEPRPVDLVALARGVVGGARVRTRRHALTVEGPDGLVATVDAVRIEQVLTNLVENAVKYSPDGGPITVSVREAAPDRVEIGVRDRGVGISPERRAHIFERYYRAHGDAQASGMGLGLYISREIVHRHGGELRADFPEDGGCRFVVTLPKDGGAPTTTGAAQR